MTSPSAAGSILAVDMGGTKVAAALFSAKGELLLRSEEPTNQQGPQPGIRQIMRLLQGLLGRAKLSSAQVMGIGVGIPAVLDPQDDRVIWAPNLKDWRDVALRPALEDSLGIPAFIEYDGHTAVLGEWWQGAGRGYRSVAMVIIGTGIGGGLILDGRLYRGHDRLAGAAGWFAMTTEAAQDSSQSRSLGHWESLAAGPGIASRARELLPNHPGSSLGRLEAFTAKEIFENSRTGDLFARQQVETAANLIGLGIANIISLINPEIVVLGGSIGCQGDLLIDQVREVVLRWAQPVSARSVTITSSKLGPNAGLYGAAYAALTRNTI
jgi:glucokinase